MFIMANFIMIELSIKSLMLVFLIGRCEFRLIIKSGNKAVTEDQKL
jgi:hypothetical protein